MKSAKGLVFLPMSFRRGGLLPLDILAYYTAEIQLEGTTGRKAIELFKLLDQEIPSDPKGLLWLGRANGLQPLYDGLCINLPANKSSWIWVLGRGGLG